MEVLEEDGVDGNTEVLSCTMSNVSNVQESRIPLNENHRHGRMRLNLERGSFLFFTGYLNQVRVRVVRKELGYIE